MLTARARDTVPSKLQDPTSPSSGSGQEAVTSPTTSLVSMELQLETKDGTQESRSLGDQLAHRHPAWISHFLSIYFMLGSCGRGWGSTKSRQRSRPLGALS